MQADLEPKYNQFTVLTLAIKPVESHTAEFLLKFVKATVAEYFQTSHKVVLFNTTDGASNMKKLSKLLGHERITCVAHSLHFLLTVDSLNHVPQLVCLVKKCKEL